MKSLLTLLFSIFLVQLNAQTPEKSFNTIDVQGYSKLPADPPTYIAQFSIQEEEQKVGFATIGKTPLDSIRLNLFTNLKKFGIEEKELAVLGISSRELSQYPNFLLNTTYEVKLKNKELAGRLVNELRFTGLKGVVIKRVFTKAQKDSLADRLYDDAINDAKRIATGLAKKANKTLGEIKTIELRNNSVNNVGTDTDGYSDNYSAYGYNRFEMDYRNRYATCYVRVIFELD